MLATGPSFVNFSSGAAVAVASLTESAGVLTGSDTVTVSGQTNWSSGVMSGTGDTLVQGGLQPSGSTEFLDARTLSNPGAATLQSNDVFEQSYGGTIQNLAGATLTILDGVNWLTGTGTGTINNQGAIIVNAGTATSTVVPDLNNTGSVVVQQGTLKLKGNGLVGGIYIIDAAGDLMDGSDSITTSSSAFPGVFTSGYWSSTFNVTASDGSGTGLASVGVSLFNGSRYFDGTAFASATPVYLPAVLNGTNGSMTTPISIFTSDATYTFASRCWTTRAEPSLRRSPRSCWRRRR